MKGEAVADTGRLESSLERLSKRGVAMMGSDAAREDQALGEPRSLVSDESLSVLLENRLEWRRERDVSDLPGLGR